MKKTFLEWVLQTKSILIEEYKCHICKSNTSEEYVCEICDEYYCEGCSSTYNQFSQIDYNCCKECQEVKDNR